MATRPITLVWTDNATNEDGFTIQRKTGHCAASGTWADLGSVGANVAGGTTTFSDPTSPIPACYRVRATSASLGDSGYSNEAATVLPQAGRARRGLRR